jgi:hypothetical protein
VSSSSLSQSNPHCTSTHKWGDRAQCNAPQAIFAVTSTGYQSGKGAKIWGPSEHTALECLQGLHNSNNWQPAGVFCCLTVGLSGRAVLHDVTI